MCSRAEFDKQRYTDRVNAGLCTACGKIPHAVGMLKCFTCSLKRKIASKERYHLQAPQFKMDAFNAYGGPICVGVKKDGTVCGETDIDVLSIDHENGGGNKHRASIGLENGGWGFYRWLKNNNYPHGFRVLCMNCQFRSHLSKLRS